MRRDPRPDQRASHGARHTRLRVFSAWLSVGGLPEACIYNPHLSLSLSLSLSLTPSLSSLLALSLPEPTPRRDSTRYPASSRCSARRQTPAMIDGVIERFGGDVPLEGRATRMRIVFDSDWEVRLRHARLGEWHATQMVTCDSESKRDVLLGNQ